MPFVVTVPCSAQILLQGTLRDPVAQTRTRFGITGGANFARINATYSGINITTVTVTSFRAGFLLDYHLKNHLYFQPRVLLSGKGGKLKTEGLEGSIRPYYLEVPLNFVYKLEAGPGKVFGGLGPYAAVGLFGNSKSGDASASFSNNLNFGTHRDDDLTPFDFGGNFLIGYEWPSGWLVSLNYSQGFYNVAPGATGDEKEKNHYFGISLGYLFGS